jgi:hypothetical protein
MRNSRRWLSVIDVPDLQLLPAHFANASKQRDGRKEPVPTVEFRAGLDSNVMHVGLLALSFPVRWGLLRSLAPYAALLKRVAEWGPLARSGSDTGGMVVLLHAARSEGDGVKSNGEGVRVHWRLYAGSGEGVQIPATPAVVLCTKLQRAHEGRAAPTGSSAALQPGAFPCLSLFNTREFALHVSLFDIAGEVTMMWQGDSGTTMVE